MSKRYRIAVFTAWLAVSAAQIAYAQDAPAAAPAPQAQDAGAIAGEIVVTAQKRQQRTADVPVSITAVSGDVLEKANITESSQLVALTPGLAWGGATGKSQPAIFLRGVGVDNYLTTSNSPVGTYTDGAYMGNTFGYGQLMLDLNRVEVLRGPQGTLWGKNTTGGLINYVPKTAEVGAPINGDFSFGAGDYGTYQSDAALGLPISDTLAVRIAGGVNRTYGYFTNDDPSQSYHQGGSTWYGIRGSIAYEPQPGAKLVAEINYSNLSGQAPPVKTMGTFDPVNYGSFTPCASASSGRLGTNCADAFGYVASSNPYSVTATSPSSEDVTTFAPILKGEFKLGDYTLNTITAYTFSKRGFSENATFTPSPYEWNFFNDQFRSYSQEIRLSSSATDRVSWIVGLYGYGDKHDIYNTTNTPYFASPQTAAFYVNKSQSFGAFADATYHVTDKLDLTGGLRYTRDQREARGELIAYNGVANGDYSEASVLANNLGIVPGANFNPGVSSDHNDVSGRIVADYHFNPRLMAFASISRGFKGGDLNGGGRTAQDFYITGPEHLTSYEAGLKGVIVRNVITTETSAFYYNYTDAQVYVQQYEDGYYVQNLTNAGKLRIYGFDGNVTVAPTHRLTFNFNYAYLNSKYISYVNPAGGTFDGNVTPYASKWQLLGHVDYHLPLGSDMSLDPSLNASYRSKVFFTSNDDPLASQPGYTVFDATVALNIRKRVRISAWVKNLTNKFYWVDGYDLSSVGINTMNPGDPRTYGASVRYTF